MERVRAALDVPAAGYRTDHRLAELSFGRWEGLTYAELAEQDPDILAIAVRSKDKWDFVPPGGESLAQLFARVRAWHAEVARDTIVVAHGGVARTLIVHFGITEPGIASAGDVAQGAVYEFAGGYFRRHE
jgi:probable phosphoglycerate mutase